MEHTNIVSSPLVGISGGKLDKEVIKKAVENLSSTPSNKRRLKKLEALHGAGFWSDFGTGFKKEFTDTLYVVGKVADVGVKLAPLTPLLMASKSAVKATGKATKTTVKYVGDHKQDIRKVVKNPIVKGAILGATSLVAPELDPVVAVALSAAGKLKRKRVNGYSLL